MVQRVRTGHGHWENKSEQPLQGVEISFTILKELAAVLPWGLTPRKYTQVPDSGISYSDRNMGTGQKNCGVDRPGDSM